VDSYNYSPPEKRVKTNGVAPIQQVEIGGPLGATHIHSRPTLPAQNSPVPTPMQPGRKLKREWIVAHMMGSPTGSPVQASDIATTSMQETDGTQQQSEFGNVSIFTSSFYLFLSNFFFKYFLFAIFNTVKVYVRDIKMLIPPPPTIVLNFSAPLRDS
jgi:hypothetical protein